MDSTRWILDDHHEQRRLFAIFEQIDRSDTATSSAVWARLAAFLDVHAELRGRTLSRRRGARSRRERRRRGDGRRPGAPAARRYGPTDLEGFLEELLGR